jgi:hypothetical protein
MTIFGGRIHKKRYLGEFYKLYIDQLLNPLSARMLLHESRRIPDLPKTTLKYSSDEELGKAFPIIKFTEARVYGHISSGTISSVESITIEMLKVFQKYYNRNTCAWISRRL